MRTFLAAAALCAATLAGSGAIWSKPAVDPNALWKIVHDHCVPNETDNAKPAPCALVNLGAGPDKGYAILKDLDGATQYLLIPTVRITGIESPALLAPDAPNYFAESWKARAFTEEAAHRPLPRQDLSLAVNSVHGRSQDQLHIHIDCVRLDVRDAVRRHLAELSDEWAPFPEPLRNHPYLAMRVVADDLAGTDPFKLLADRVPGARAAMGDHTLVVVGAEWPDGRAGFAILADRFDPAIGDRAGGEELQDHACAAARS